jgi:GNAT superfamily N-acetyltransferase
VPRREHQQVDLVLRPAGAEDHTSCADIYLQARAEAIGAGTMPPAVHGDDEVRGWMRDVVLADREVWLACTGADAAPVGLLVLDTEWLDHLYVRPAAWRTGVASALLSLAKGLRPGGFSLWVFEINTPARQLYERHGLVAVRRTDGADNEEGAPDVEYAWRPSA